MKIKVNNAHGAFLLSVVGFGVSGCVAVNATTDIQRASSLTQAKTGFSPDWSKGWDEDCPNWAAGEVLTQEQALQYALRNNRELRAEIETIGQAQADFVQAGLLQNPVLTFATKFPSGGGRAMFEGGLIPFQGIRDLWLIPIRKEAASAALHKTLLRVVDQSISISARVKVLYVKTQHLQRSIELTREHVAIAEQTVQLIQSRHAAGQTSQIEVNMERIRGLRLRADLRTMQAEQKRLQHELLMMMGFAGASISWSVTPIHESQSMVVALPDANELVSAALIDRLDLCSARWDVWQAGRELAIARGEAWPAFDVSIVFEREGAPQSQNPSFAAMGANAAVAEALGGGADMPTPEPFGPKPRDTKWMVGPMLDLEIPLFDQNQAQIAKAAHEMRRRLALQSALEQSVIQKVHDLKISYDQAGEQVTLFRSEILPEVDANLELIKQSYRTGADVFTNYLRAQEDLIGTRQNALAFLRDAAINRAELEREVGGRIPDAVEAMIKEQLEAPAPPPSQVEVTP